MRLRDNNFVNRVSSCLLIVFVIRMHGSVGNNLFGISVRRDGQNVAGIMGVDYEGQLVNVSGTQSDCASAPG
jgi:hypothetical protein